MSEDRYLSKRAFLERVPVSLPTLNRRLADGTVASVKFGSRVLIPESALAAISAGPAARSEKQ